METRIKTTDYQLVPEVQSYLDERLGGIEKLLGSLEDSARAEVELGRSTAHASGDVYFAEVNLIITGANMHATATAASVNAAIDEVKDDIMEQLRKHKQLHRSFVRKGGAALKRLMRFGGAE